MPSVRVALGSLVAVAIGAGACDVGNAGDLRFKEPPPETAYEAALQIFGADSDCVACVERECRGEARDCEQAAECAEQAICRSDCRDPNCGRKCDVPYPTGAQPIQALIDCTETRCTEDCRVGQDWDCVGGYTWGPFDGEPVVLTLELVCGWGFAPAAEGMLARVCEWDDETCTNPVHESYTNADGVVALTFPTNVGRFNESFVPFAGYDEYVDPDPDRDPPRILKTMGFVGGSEIDAVPESHYPSQVHPWQIGVCSPDDAVAGYDWFGVEPDASKGQIWAWLYDCRGMDLSRGRDFAIEIEPHDDGTQIDDQRDGPGTDGAFFAWNVPPGLVTVTARAQGRIVAKTELYVRADWVSLVSLDPSSSE